MRLVRPSEGDGLLPAGKGVKPRVEPSAALGLVTGAGRSVGPPFRIADGLGQEGSNYSLDLGEGYMCWKSADCGLLGQAFRWTATLLLALIPFHAAG